MLLKILFCVHGTPLFLQFAVVQFSKTFQIESSFTDSDQINLERNIGKMTQLSSWTWTGPAISFVV